MVQNQTLGPAALWAVGKLTLLVRMRKERPLEWGEVETGSRAGLASIWVPVQIPVAKVASAFQAPRMHPFSLQGNTSHRGFWVTEADTRDSDSVKAYSQCSLGCEERSRLVPDGGGASRVG